MIFIRSNVINNITSRAEKIRVEWISLIKVGFFLYLKYKS